MPTHPKNKKNLSVFTYLSLTIFLVSLVILIFYFSPLKNDWICKNGHWVKQGRPTASQPVRSCPDGDNTKSIPLIISNYNDCVAAGYPVQPSYPARCATLEGTTYTKNVGSEAELLNNIKISAPRPNDLITPPLTITGQAIGSWFNEAEFPIYLLDANGQTISATSARTEADWMTDNFLPFTATLEFENPGTATGTLVLSTANPSGLEKNRATLSIPVSFIP